MIERQRSVPVPVPGIASRLRPALPPKVPDPSLPACRGPRFMGEERRPTRDVESGSERRSLACQKVGAGSPVILLCGRRVLTGERRLGPLISTSPSESQGFVWCIGSRGDDGW
jgi:hypothetical protein